MVDRFLWVKKEASEVSIATPWETYVLLEITQVGKI